MFRYVTYAKYLPIVAVAAFLSVGGPPPDVGVSQDGGTTTSHNYGQPLNFHYKAIYAKLGETTRQVNTSPYDLKQVSALAADVAIWTVLIWAVVRMAEQKPIVPQKRAASRQELHDAK